MNIHPLVHEISHVTVRQKFCICKLAFDLDDGIKVTKRYSAPGLVQKVYLCKSERNQGNGSRNLSFLEEISHT